MTNYFDIYLNHLFVTLGQLSAVILSSIVVIPVYTYYLKMNLRKDFKNIIKKDT